MKNICCRKIQLVILFLTSSLLLSCSKVKEAFEDQPLVPPAQKACGFVQNSYGQRVSWKDRTPSNFTFNRNVPSEVKATILAAASRWNQSLGRDIIVIANGNDTSEKWANEGRNVIYWVDQSGVFTNPFIQAKSLIRWTGNQIVDVDILVNAVNWKFGDITQQKGVLDLESLMVHEFGHSLGLLHQSMEESVMFQSLNLNTQRTKPFENPDLEALKCEYQP